MTDPYLLLTPVLALAVLALARFVGCGWVFRLDEVPDVPDQPGELSFVRKVTLGQPRNDTTMNPFTGWVGMEILVGGTALTVTHLGRLMRTASTTAHDVKLVERAGDSGGVDVRTVTIPPTDPILESENNGFAYATLPPPEVVLKAGTLYYIVSHESATS